MAFNRPTLAEIVARVEADVVGKLGLTVPVMTRAVSRVLARAVAGASHMQHGRIDYLIRQIFPQTQEADSLELDAASYGLTRNPAAFSSGGVEFAGVNGTVVPTDTLVTRADGVQYRVTTGGTVALGVLASPVVATVAGADGDAPDGALMTLVSPIAGITGVTADGDIGGGAEQEDIEDFRQRVLEAMRAESLGGSDEDYVGWAKAVAGVTRAWVYRHEQGLGTVTVRFVRDGDSPIVPSAGEVADVQEALGNERPVTAEIFVEAPIDDPVAFTVSIVPDTPELRNEVEQELIDLFFVRAEPGDGAGRGTVLLSEMRTSIGVVSADYTLTAPVLDYVPATGALGTVGVITWS